MNNELSINVSPSPHLRSKGEVRHAMRDVIIALLPVTAVSIYWFGLSALFLIALCMVTALITEVVFKKLLQRKQSCFDGSALVTGLLIALCFTANTPWWTAVIATVIGVGIAKELMGGTGWNLFNPALFGRVSAIIFAPLLLNGVNTVFKPLGFSIGTIDTVTRATPLALLKQGALTDMPGLDSLFLWHPGGALAETSALMLLLGGAYLLFRGHIRWHVPAAIIGTVALIALIFETGKLGPAVPLYHVFAGGVLLGAIFMATDWVTAPITSRGKVVFGICIGILIMVFRLFLAPVEGTAFSILIMNAFVPLIDRVTRRPKFGEVKVKERLSPGITEPAKRSV